MCITVSKTRAIMSEKRGERTTITKGAGRGKSRDLSQGSGRAEAEKRASTVED